MRKVPVKLRGSDYTIFVEPGLISKVGAELRRLSDSKRVAIVTDSHVAPLHLAALEKSLNDADFQTVSATIPAGEQHKTLPMLMPVFDQFLSAKIERSTPILAFGGGVIGDMTGFLAATILRGVPFVQVPTTLLAMVDASIGGKTGVDHSLGKNLIGAFHQPIAVFSDPELLHTLPPRQFQDGLAECIKHALIRDAEGFARFDRQLEGILRREVKTLSEVIAHSAAIKAGVVQKDPFEKGDRAHLNFGHTFGHAIETVSHYSYSHGQAVALGMAAAAYTSAKLEMIDEKSRERILSTIQKAGLPVSGLSLDTDLVMQAMQHDKKVLAGRIRLILLKDIGRAVMRDDVPAALIRDAVESLR
jgi:3-dehydroquinate synthase